MRQRLLIIVSLIVVVGILLLLNAASYVKVEEVADTEASPDRSTLNAGATGTRALFDFLHESGFQVARWRESTESLLSFNGPKPATIVVVGPTQTPFSDTDRKELLHWVETGGRLVIIDRNPEVGLLPSSGDWLISDHANSFPWTDVDPTNIDQMTKGVKPATPSQPTSLVRDVTTIVPSRFAGNITVTANEKKDKNKAKETSAGGATEDEPDSNDSSAAPSPASGGYETSLDEAETANVSPAPVLNFSREGGALLADYPHGKGRIVVLSDPFIVACERRYRRRGIGGV
jgi:hypothetical protein